MATSHPNTMLDVVILAAGKGTRLKSQLPKVLHPLFGQSLLAYVIHTATALSPQRIVIVVGHQKEQVCQAIEALKQELATSHPSIEIITVVQEPQQGTGHAMQCVAKAVPDLSPTAMLLSGDVPLIQAHDLETLLQQHLEGNHAITVMGADVPNPEGYGRLLVDNQSLTGIVEHKDANDTQRSLHLVNAGIYAFNSAMVHPLLNQLTNNNAQGEWYITDLVGLSLTAGHTVGYTVLGHWQDMQGVNTRADLTQCLHALNQRHIEAHMAGGATILDPHSTFIGPKVTLGTDVTLYPGCWLDGHTKIGDFTTIGPNCQLTHAIIGSHVTLRQSVVTDSAIGDHATVGPFAHIRSNADVGDHVRLGNFIEVKNSVIGNNSNAAHLSYLGDTDIGSHANMGAGSIVANYDPVRKQKHRTTIGNGAMVGCNSVLVAPVSIGDNACVAAGSVITKPVEADALAVARAKDRHIAGWVAQQQNSTLPV